MFESLDVMYVHDKGYQIALIQVLTGVTVNFRIKSQTREEAWPMSRNWRHVTLILDFIV